MEKTVAMVMANFLPDVPWGRFAVLLVSVSVNGKENNDNRTRYFID